MNELTAMELQISAIIICISILTASVVIRKVILFHIDEQRLQRSMMKDYNEQFVSHHKRVLDIHTGNFSNKFANDTKSYIDKMILETSIGRTPLENTLETPAPIRSRKKTARKKPIRKEL